MGADYQLERERISQLNSVRRAAHDYAVPEGLAVAIYEREWQRLHERARVHRFVGVLAEKHAKDAMRGGLQ